MFHLSVVTITSLACLFILYPPTAVASSELTCATTNGTQLNTLGDCHCGTTNCTTVSGMYCVAARNKCFGMDALNEHISVRLTEMSGVSVGADVGDEFATLHGNANVSIQWKAGAVDTTVNTSTMDGWSVQNDAISESMTLHSSAVSSWSMDGAQLKQTANIFQSNDPFAGTLAITAGIKAWSSKVVQAKMKIISTVQSIAVHSVTRVRIRNRVGCCQDRINGGQVFVGDNSNAFSSENTQCGNTITNGTIAAQLTFECDPPIVGRYVFVRVPGDTKVINIAEVKVEVDGKFFYGGDPSQSSESYWPEYFAAKARDGSDSFSHTHPQTNPWWRLDMGDHTHFNRPTGSVGIAFRVVGTGDYYAFGIHSQCGLSRLIKVTSGITSTIGYGSMNLIRNGNFEGGLGIPSEVNSSGTWEITQINDGPTEYVDFSGYVLEFSPTNESTISEYEIHRRATPCSSEVASDTRPGMYEICAWVRVSNDYNGVEEVLCSRFYNGATEIGTTSARSSFCANDLNFCQFQTQSLLPFSHRGKWHYVCDRFDSGNTPVTDFSVYTGYPILGNAGTIQVTGLSVLHHPDGWDRVVPLREFEAQVLPGLGDTHFKLADLNGNQPGEYPWVLYSDGEFHPICGHWFWNDEVGADTFCRNLGYQSGVRDPQYNDNKAIFSTNAVPVGNCNVDEDLDACTGGGNVWNDMNTENNYCHAGKSVGMKVKCSGVPAEGNNCQNNNCRNSPEFDIRIIAVGRETTIYVNGDLHLRAVDEDVEFHASGKIGLLSSGNEGSYFRDVVVFPLGASVTTSGRSVRDLQVATQGASRHSVVVARGCATLGVDTGVACRNWQVKSTTVPDPPQSVVVRVYDQDTLQVTIEPPLNDGGANITHYETIITYDQCESVANDSIIGDWDFATGASEAKVGKNVVVNEGFYDNDGLVLSEKYAMTSEFSVALAARTMTSCFTLNSLDGENGAVFAVDLTSGHRFDAIVWGEVQEHYWMLGSNNFARTNHGTQFGTAAMLQDIEQSRETCMTITQSASGRVCGYRNGILYGACCKLYLCICVISVGGVCPCSSLTFSSLFP